MPEDLNFVKNIVDGAVIESEKLFMDLQTKVLELLQEYAQNKEGGGLNLIISMLANMNGQMIAIYMTHIEKEFVTRDMDEFRDKMFKDITRDVYKVIRKSIVQHYKRLNQD